MKIRIATMLSASVLLSACTSNWDMQGQDPKDYYKEHPIKNMVETRSESHLVHFNPGATRLTADQIDALFAGIASITPMAAESVQIQMHRNQVNNGGRREHLVKLLRNRGYSKHMIMFEPSEALSRDDVRIDISYAKVVSPRCPDWRTSPVTTYSNTSQGGYGCASVANLGLMVADPHDLERGKGAVMPPDSERNHNVLLKYHANESVAGSGGAPVEAQGSSEPSSSGQTQQQ
jgi:pilus assembly protein CpaD